MKDIFTKAWLTASASRAIRTFAQNAIAVITTTAAATNMLNIDWLYVGSSSLLAAIISMLISITGLPELSESNSSWIAAAALRALKTFCESALAVIGTAMIMSEVNWILVASTAGLAAVLSILTSLAGLPEVGTTESNDSGDDE